MLAHPKFIGYSWVILGIVAAPYDIWSLTTLALDPEYGYTSSFYEPSWWATQAVFPLVFVAAFFAGYGVLQRHSWGTSLLRVIAPLVFLYSLAYTIFGGERAWWYALLGVWGVVLGWISIKFAYRGHHEHKT